jgi:hypothetical protein
MKKETTSLLTTKKGFILTFGENGLLAVKIARTKRRENIERDKMLTEQAGQEGYTA